MEYQVEDLSPVKKKVTVQVPAEEVNAALGTTAALFGKDLKLSGFRKGKVPTSIVESRFKKDVQEQASKDLLNVHFNQIFGEHGVTPMAGLEVDADLMERDKDYNYSLTFEIFPEIDLPEYHGLKERQNKIKVPDNLIDKSIERLQKENSELHLVREERYPQDGDVAVISFAAYQDEQLIEGVKTDNFELPLGEGQSLKEFEDIVKRLLPGQTGEEEITFPDDFINPDLAGKTVSMRVTLNVIKERVLPELDEDFAQKVGGYDSMDQVREELRKYYNNYFNSLEKSSVQKRLLDQILEQIEVTIPETMLKNQLDQMIESKREKLERQGKSLESEGGEEALREQMQDEAKELVKGHLVLLAIAKQEELSVSNQEMDMQLFSIARETGQDPKEVKEYYEKNNLMYALQDRLLADKAMNLVYDYAEIEEVDPEAKEKQEDTEGETKDEVQNESEDSAGEGD